MSKATSRQWDLIRRYRYDLQWDLDMNKGKLTRLATKTFGKFMNLRNLSQQEADKLIQALEEEWQKELEVRKEKDEEHERHRKEMQDLIGF